MTSRSRHFFRVIAVSAAFFALSTSVLAQESFRPNLEIAIPTIHFSGITTLSGGQVGGVPWIAEYVSGLYSYAVGLAALIASVMAMTGGFLYLTAGGDASRVQKGRERISNAIIGLLLTLGAYTILNTVSGDLVSLKHVNVKRVPPEVALFDELGTGDPAVSESANADVSNMQAPAGSQSVAVAPPEGGSGGGTSGGGTSSPPGYSGGGNPSGGGPPVEPPGGRVDVSAITYDKSKSFLENLNKYCARKADGTYEEKVNRLVQAVLGFIEVCVNRRGCAYAQGGFTVLPNGPAAANWLPNFSVKALAGHGHPPEQVFASAPQCLEALNLSGDYAPGGSKNPRNIKDGYSLLIQPDIVGMCDPPADNAMKQYYLNPLNEAKIFAGDCGTTVRQILTCAFGAPGASRGWQDIVTFTNPKSGPKTTYPNATHVDAHDDDPRMIVSAYQKENIDAEAAKKGGMRFGDMVYTCCGGDPGSYSAHWFMYIGGRPEIPYSFIEMGGNPAAPYAARSGGASIPGWGQTGGVVLSKANVSLEQRIRPSFTPQPPTWCKPCSKGCPCTVPPKKGVNNALVFVWRPFVEGSSAPAPAAP